MKKLTAILSILLFLFASGAARAEGFAKISSVIGEVSVMPKGETGWVSAVSGQPVAFGDQIRTGSEGRTELVYPDGTIFRMAPGSCVEMRLKSINILQGGTWVKVIKRASRFEVVTPTATAGVRGTVFDVEYAEKTRKTVVSVYNGQVAVSGRGRYSDRVVMLSQGTQTEVDKTPGHPRKFNVSDRQNLWTAELRQTIETGRKSSTEARVTRTAAGSEAKPAIPATVKVPVLPGRTDTPRVSAIGTRVQGTAPIRDSAPDTVAVEARRRLEEELARRKVDSIYGEGRLLSADREEREKQIGVIAKGSAATKDIKLDNEVVKASLYNPELYRQELLRIKEKAVSNMSEQEKAIAERIFDRLDYGRINQSDRDSLEKLLKNERLSTAQKSEAQNILLGILNRGATGAEATDPKTLESLKSTLKDIVSPAGGVSVKPGTTLPATLPGSIKLPPNTTIPTNITIPPNTTIPGNITLPPGVSIPGR